MQKGKIKREDFPKGRWYGSFVSMPIEKFSPSLAESAAGHINCHLYAKARKIIPQGRHIHREKSQGILQNQDNAISHNTLQRAQSQQIAAISEEIWAKYSKAAGGNIAARIKNKILQEQEKAGDKEKPYNRAVEILRKHVWEQVFNNARNYETASKLEGGAALLAAHNAVKDSYRRLLKGRSFFVEKQKPLVSGNADWQEKIKILVCEKIEQILPGDDEALFRLMSRKSQNRNLAALIRLGKIIHYTAARKGNAEADNAVFIVQNWPSAEEVRGSFYWSSQGQTEIKQSEAFVRVWRRALAFAARSLKDWADPENKIAGGIDILGDKEGKKAIEDCSEDEARKKYILLFADENPLRPQKELLELARKGIADLRNAAFHFKGLGVFVDALLKDDFCIINGDLKDFLEDRFQKHQQKRQERLKESLVAAGLPYYIGIAEARVLWHKIGADNSSLLPLPRLRRVLERAEKAWKGGKQGKDNEGHLLPEIKLPNYVSAKDREENEADACRWIVLKLLYDGSFKAWLDRLSHNDLQVYIDKAVARATEAAQFLNKKNDSGEIKSAEELVWTVARSDRLRQLLEPGDTIESFFYKLTGETATEMRVQKGYDSDAAKAQEQAKYIEDLKCDVVALAFADYLQQQGLSFVLDMDKKPKKEEPHFCIKQLVDVKASAAPCLWQAKLYFLLHLIPVEEASSLRQQIRKYQITTAKKESGGGVSDRDRPHLQHGDENLLARELVQVLDLYIFMHDAQYFGNELTRLGLKRENIEKFYEDKEDFIKVFPLAPKKQNSSVAVEKEQEEYQHLPVRDLREMQRFAPAGFFENMTIFRVKISAVQNWLALKQEVEGDNGAQRKLQDLHEDWIKNGKKPEWKKGREGKNGRQGVPDGYKYKSYKQILEKVGDYRLLTAQVRLQGHLRLYRLLIAVLGRLVDFSGLFERDLYFVMLALLHNNKIVNLKAQFEDVQAITSIESLHVKEQEIARYEEQKRNLVGGSFLEQGRVIEAFCKLKDAAVKAELTKLFGITGKEEGESEEQRIKNLPKTDIMQAIRNRFAHLAMLEKQNMPVNLTREVNNARCLMAYDRKLKNAVSQSVKELLEREGRILTWQMKKENGRHDLCRAEVKTGKAYHLKKSKSGKKGLEEDKHSRFYVETAKSLFGADRND